MKYLEITFQQLSLCKIKCFTLENQVRKLAPRKLKALQKKLKGLSTKWAQKVIEKMAEVDSEADKNKLYNILNGSIQDKRWHIIFIGAATKVIEELETEQKSVV